MKKQDGLLWAATLLALLALAALLLPMLGPRGAARRGRTGAEHLVRLAGDLLRDLSDGAAARAV